MCGIVGSVGSRNAAQVILDGLERLEYRGYDSAGLAGLGPEGLTVIPLPLLTCHVAAARGLDSTSRATWPRA
jgi:glutamine phosphoribosylpyrophosphate amidotransferase